MEELRLIIKTAHQVGVFMDLPESQEKVLCHIGIDGEKDAYGTHKDTGIKLTTTQAAIKGLSEKGLISVLRTETSVKGQKKIIYSLTMAGLKEAIKCCYKGDNIRHGDISKIISRYQDGGPLLFKHWEELIRADPDLSIEWEFLLFKSVALSLSAPESVDNHFFDEVEDRVYRKPDAGILIDVLFTIPELGDKFQEYLNKKIVYHRTQLERLSKYVS